jgi:hypothetical protein
MMGRAGPRGGEHCNFFDFEKLRRVRQVGRGAGNVPFQSLSGPLERYSTRARA